MGKNTREDDVADVEATCGTTVAVAVGAGVCDLNSFPIHSVKVSTFRQFDVSTFEHLQHVQHCYISTFQQFNIRVIASFQSFNISSMLFNIRTFARFLILLLRHALPLTPRNPT